MELFTPFASSYANGPPSWHHSGHFEPSFHDDSGYASEDYDFVPFLSLDPDDAYGDNDHADHHFSRTRRHRAAAFVNAQWSRPAAFRAYHPFHDSLNDSWRTYDLPQPLSFEQQRNTYASGSRLRPTTFYNRQNFSREHGPTASRWGFENISPLDVEEHRARIPDALPSLRNRIESETDHSSPSSSSIRHGSPSPEVRVRGPPSGSSTTSAQPGHRTENSTRASARRQRHDQSVSRDAQLAAAWQQLYQERTELEKERRALNKKENSLLQRKRRPRSSRRDPSDDADGKGRRGSHGTDSTAKSDESAV